MWQPNIHSVATESIRHACGLHDGMVKKLRTFDFTGKAVLDYGCGTGYLTKVIAETAARVTGYDTNPHVLTFAREINYGPNIDYTDTLHDGFDIIIFNSSLEYMDDWRDVLDRYKDIPLIIFKPNDGVYSRFDRYIPKTRAQKAIKRMVKAAGMSKGLCMTSADLEGHLNRPFKKTPFRYTRSFAKGYVVYEVS